MTDSPHPAAPRSPSQIAPLNSPSDPARADVAGGGATGSAETLHATLRRLGWSSADAPGNLRHGRRVFDAAGTCLGVLTAHETWALLRERGLVAS